MTFALTSTVQVAARGSLSALLPSMRLVLTTSVTQTAALLTTLLLMIQLSALQMAVESPTLATVSQNRVVSPLVDRKIEELIELCLLQQNIRINTISYPFPAFTKSIAKSSLRRPLRHPAKPVQRTRRGDIEADVNPQESEISPSVGKADTDLAQEVRGALDRAVLADTYG
jgi:hypothetical protein